MQPQFIPNGTLVAFNKGHVFSNGYDDVICEIIGLCEEDFYEENTVYRLKFDPSVPQDIRNDLTPHGEDTFLCHVAYFELADIPVDVPDISSLL